jgi:hypothetical protein
MHEARELIVAEIERNKQVSEIDMVVRVYVPDISPNVLVFESVIQSAEAHDKFWAEYNASPEGQAFWAKWHAVAKRRLGIERWFVDEFR